MGFTIISLARLITVFDHVAFTIVEIEAFGAASIALLDCIGLEFLFTGLLAFKRLDLGELFLLKFNNNNVSIAQLAILNRFLGL